MTTNKPVAVAWMTHHDEPMLFPSEREAASYCGDGEEPVALIRLSDYETLQADCESLLEEVMRLRVAMAKAAQRADDWPGSNDDPADVLSDCASILFDALDYR